MKELDVLGVRVEMPTNNPIVLLRERDGQRYVPIWIGAPEATAIAYAQQGVEPPRPLTHDLMVTMIESLGRRLEKVHINKLHEGVFHAELHFDAGTVLSARPSDAIALALRSASPILATEELLDEVGVTMAVEEEEEDEVERFRQFLDNVSAEDFDGEEDDDNDDSGDDDGKPGERP